MTVIALVRGETGVPAYDAPHWVVEEKMLFMFCTLSTKWAFSPMDSQGLGPERDELKALLKVELQARLKVELKALLKLSLKLFLVEPKAQGGASGGWCLGSMYHIGTCPADMSHVRWTPRRFGHIVCMGRGLPLYMERYEHGCGVWAQERILSKILKLYT